MYGVCEKDGRPLTTWTDASGKKTLWCNQCAASPDARKSESPVDYQARARQIWDWRAQDLRTFEDIALEVGVTSVRARQIYLGEVRKRRDTLDGAISRRALNVLKRSGILPKEVPGMSDDDLLALRNAGTQFLVEVRRAFPSETCPNWVGEGVPALAEGG